MKSKKTSLFLVFSFFCLVFSGLFYFTSPIHDKEKQVEVLIVSGVNKWQQERLKAGVDQAAKELGTEIIYKEVSSKEYLRQKEKIKTEKTNLIGTVTYGGKISRKKSSEDQKTINLELENFQSKMGNNKEAVSTDYQRGITLGSHLIKQLPIRHLIYWQAQREDYSKERLSGLLKNKGLNEGEWECVSGGIVKVMRLAHSYAPSSDVCLVLDNPQQLNDYVEFSKLNAQDSQMKTYMFEFSDKVLEAIDDEEILGAVFQDDYSRGYQSIYQLMGTKREKQRELPQNRIINKKNLFSKGIEPLIFPYDE